MVDRIEASRLLSATRLSARSVTCPSERVSWTMSSTTAGEVPMAMEAAMAESTTRKSSATNEANTAPKVSRLSAAPEAASVQSRFIQSRFMRRPRSKSTSPSARSTKMRAWSTRGLSARASITGAIIPPTTT